MPIDVACPACAATLRVGDDLAGKVVRCAGCQAVVPVPAAPAPRSLRPAPPPARRRGARFWVLLAAGSALLTAVVAGGGYYALAVPRWREHQSDQGGFKVELPAAPRPGMGGLASTPDFTVEGTTLRFGQEAYSVGYGTLPPERLRVGEEVIIQDAIDGMLKASPGSRAVRSDAVEVSGFAGRDVTIDVPGKGTAVARLVLADDRAFTLIVTGPTASQENPRARRFLDSFAVTDPRLVAVAVQKREFVQKTTGRVEFTLTHRIGEFGSENGTFDPARKAFWTATADRLRRYSLPDFRFEAEYRLPRPVSGLVLVGDRLVAGEHKPNHLVAFDIRSLPPPAPEVPPLLTVAARSVEFPGDAVAVPVADPDGRWVYTRHWSGQGAIYCRFPANLSGKPAQVVQVGAFSPGQLSRDGKTFYVAHDTPTGTCWVDVDVATWDVVRRQEGDREKYHWWARSPERTFATKWMDAKPQVFEWSGPGPSPTTKNPMGGFDGPAAGGWLQFTPDGRYVFFACRVPNPQLRAYLADVRPPMQRQLPVSGSVVLADTHSGNSWPCFSPDGSQVVVSNGQVFTVRYPPD